MYGDVLVDLDLRTSAVPSGLDHVMITLSDGSD